MAPKARKKVTKQEAKAKKARRQANVSGARKAVPKKNAPMVSAQKTAKKIEMPALNTPINPKATKRVLHIHAGNYHPDKIHKSFRTEEWQEVRLDETDATNPDIVSPITHLNSIENNSFDALYNTHSLPKLHFHQLEHTVQEWFRVLKEEGLIVLSVPDMRAAANYIARDQELTSLYDTPVGPVTPVDMLYGHRRLIGQGNEHHQHKMGFTPTMIGNVLREVGFSNINVTIEGFNIWAVGYKLPYDHPKRVEKVVIAAKSDDAADDALPEATAKPRITAHKPNQHPGFIKDGMLSDELDIPPKHWKALEL